MPDNHMFINLSNHPSSKWTESQIKAAEQYGEIVDMHFPNVDPAGDTTYIDDLANEYAQRVNSIANGTHSVVHIMGEMTLTFAIIIKLQKMNINCVCSTTERIVEELDNGEKKVLFNFVKFRDYAKM